MFFTEQQAQRGAKVVVIGPLIAEARCGPNQENAINKLLRINHTLFRVIGVPQSFGKAGDNVIMMPVNTARSGVFGYGYGYGYGGDELSQLIVKATSTKDVKVAEAQITEVPRERHGIKDPRYDDFQVQDLGSRLTTFTDLINLITGFVPPIAAISLLVGGVGVLNIMLVSVTDRTREIGTRKAIGASDSAILSQFVLESIALAGLGGFVGLLWVSA